MLTARSLLFVPGSTPERFDRAARSGADGVIIDLEDGVAPTDKERARAATRAWLTSVGSAVVRVSAVTASQHAADMAAVGSVAAAIMIAKCESPSDVALVREVADRPVPVVPLVETARAIVAIDDLCATEGVARIALGNIDLATELGVDPQDDEAMRYVRSRLVVASAAAGLPAPLDGVTTDVVDGSVAGAHARRARRLGMGGKLCVHPRQVTEVNAAFSPSAEELAWARKIVEREADALFVFGGEMVDAPVIARARRLLELAERLA